MSFQVTLQTSGRQFSCEPDETILSAALRAGVGLPYGCKNGACSSCRGKLLSGSVSHGAHQEKALSVADAALGFALFCCARPESDVLIEVREVAGVGDLAIRKMPARIATLEKISDDVIVMSLQLPANERLHYLAGQYLEFLLRDGQRRSYSIASAPSHEGHLTLHIRHMPGGLFTDALFSSMKERDIVRFEGPLGTFFLRQDSDKPMILLASGTGFAPLKALIEQAQYDQSPRHMTLYWGGRRPHDLYMDGLCRHWAATLPNFHYVPVISNAETQDHWQGRSGLVHQAVIADHPDLSAYQVYACGAPIMVESAQRDLVALCKLPADEFYADAFTSAADLAI